MIRILTILLALCHPAPAAGVRLSWPASPEPDVDGYVIYWRAEQAGERELRVGGNAASIPDIGPGEHRFQVAAVNTAGLESVRSDEAVWNEPLPAAVSRFSPGDRVTTGGNRVNARETPGLSGEWIRTMPAGSGGIVLDGFVAMDGYVWAWIAWDDGTLGWSGDDLISAEVPLPGIAAVPPDTSVRVTLQRSSGLGDWSDLSIHDETTEGSAFFRLKIEPAP